MLEFSAFEGDVALLRGRGRQDVLRGGGDEGSAERGGPRAEAAQMGAEIIATSCPFCLMTLEDPAKEKGQTVKELSEILMEVSE